MKLATAFACLALAGLIPAAVAPTAIAQTARSPAGATTPTMGVTPSANAPGQSPASKAAAANGTAASDQFKDEASAKSHCPSDSVVWVNLGSKAYHASGTKYYGKTKNGAYECQKDADADGFHAAGHKKTAAATPTPVH